MAAFYKWLISMLVWLSADPAAIDAEQPKAAAAVAAARASMVREAGPTPPAPAPTECDCGATCVRGIWKPDGRVEQKCGCGCRRCVGERAKGAQPCPDGKCPTR